MDFLGESLTTTLIQISLIIIGAYLIHKLLMLPLERLVRRAVRARSFKSARDEKQREDTIISILNALMRVTVWTVAFLMVLSVFGINIGPLLAGAGVVGVALGFGAQTMVKDFLAGIFIIAENQYRVGDVLEVNQTVSGIVERVSLRATVLRDLSGMVHYIPNGVIEIATNMTMEFANVELNMRVSYDTDIDKLEAVINKTGQTIADDEAWKDVALEAPYMLRVDAFDETGIIVKVVCKTAPIRQWDVKSEILRRLKVAFEKEGIVIPYPQRVIHEAKATVSNHKK